MQAVQYTIDKERITTTVLGNISTSSFGTIRASLAMYANRLYGVEGKHWRMAQKHHHRLVPFYIKEIGGLESEIHAE